MSDSHPNNKNGKIWRIVGPVLAGLLIAAMGWGYTSLEKRVTRMEDALKAFGRIEEKVINTEDLLKIHMGLK